MDDNFLYHETTTSYMADVRVSEQCVFWDVTITQLKERSRHLYGVTTSVKLNSASAVIWPLQNIEIDGYKWDIERAMLNRGTKMTKSK